MDVKILKAEMNDFEEIIDVLVNSSLGQRYYPTPGMLRSEVLAARGRDLFLVARDEGRLVGFAWYMLTGAFALYPYLHTIVVEESCRSGGIGRTLMKAYENSCLELKHELRCKSFLVVSEDNRRAISFYKRLGYEALFPIKKLFRKNVTEILMEKDICKAV